VAVLQVLASAWLFGAKRTNLHEKYDYPKVCTAYDAAVAAEAGGGDAASAHAMRIGRWLCAFFESGSASALPSITSTCTHLASEVGNASGLSLLELQRTASGACEAVAHPFLDASSEFARAISPAQWWTEPIRLVQGVPLRRVDLAAGAARCGGGASIYPDASGKLHFIELGGEDWGVSSHQAADVRQMAFEVLLSVGHAAC
jgi:hypothetical protein